MESELKIGWAEVPLDELCNMVYGKGLLTKNLTDEGFPVYGANGIIGKYSKYIYEKPQVIISCRGAASGVIHKTVPKSFVTSNSIVLGLKSEEISLDFFKYAMLSVDRTKIVTGSAQPQITIENLNDLQIPLAPLPEQYCIVAKLDELMEKTERSKKRLEKIPLILKRFRQSVLAAAVSGKLTEEWRRKNKIKVDSSKLLEQTLKQRKEYWLQLEKEIYLKKNKKIDEKLILSKYKEPKKPTEINFDAPKEWAICTWDHVSNWVTYGFTRPMPHVEKGIPIITVKQVRNSSIDFENCDYTTHKAFELLNPKDKPQKGDILITKDGATLGRAAIVETSFPFCIGQSVAVVWLRSNNIEKKFLLYVIESKFIQDIIWEVARGMGMPHLSITDFMEINFALPSFKEQHEIVSRVEALFAFADKIETRYTKAKTQFDKLPQALLAKAFKGELVEQDEKDEPAGVLLERIKAEKEKNKKGNVKIRNIKPKKYKNKQKMSLTAR